VTAWAARRRWIGGVAAALCWLLFAPAAAAQDDASNQVFLEVRLDQHLLADAITGYQIGDDVFLPLGELSKLLTIAIRAQPGEGRASGYILDEQRGFSLDVGARAVTLNNRREAVDPALVNVRADDIYVASKLLSRWLPAELKVDLPSLTLRVQPREKLPLQARLDRANIKPGVRGRYVDPGFARAPTPYRLLDVPVIDQTLGIDVRQGQRASRQATYTAYATADLAGMEAQLFASSGWPSGGADVRWTLGRNDPDAGVLGPLHARSAQVGSVMAPAVLNIAQSYSNGHGAVLSNRPLNQPAAFDRHSLQGPLPPGWDVELYFNEALVAVQQSRPDGKYSFDDLPLVYGANDFRLVFHGPLGQLRIERQHFLLEQSMLAPGQLYYNLSRLRDENGAERALAQFEWGLGKYLNATGGVTRLPQGAFERRYTSLGLRAYLQSLIVTADVARSDQGGTLAQASAKTRLLGLSLAASHAQLRDFASEIYPKSGDPVRSRDELAVDGMLGTAGALQVPLSLQARQDRFVSGQRSVDLLGRLSTYKFGTAVSNTLHWQSLRAAKSADGVLQLSRRVAGIGVSAQVLYAVKPQFSTTSVAVSADKMVADGYLLNLGVARAMASGEQRFTAALNKSLGRYGLSVNGFLASHGGFGVGARLFVALGREPRSGAWITDAQPMAGSGAASVRVFLDKNENGVMDAGDEPLAGAGFTINGGGTLARTGADGIAYLNRLPARQNVDIGFDASTLDDPQLAAQQKGYRIAARAGKVSQLDFAVSITGELDGTAYLLADGAKRGIGDLLIELVDAGGKVATSIKSSADGYFVLSYVRPGKYLLRISPDQLRRLGMADSATHTLTMAADGASINGRDFVVVPAVNTAH
jgi:hypothetical protein